MPLCFSSFFIRNFHTKPLQPDSALLTGQIRLNLAPFGPRHVTNSTSTAVYLAASHLNRRVTRKPAKHLATLNRTWGKYRRDLAHPGTIAGPMLMRYNHPPDFHSSPSVPFTGSAPALTLMLSRLRGRAVRQTSHDLTKSGTFCIDSTIARLSHPTVKRKTRGRGRVARSFDFDLAFRGRVAHNHTSPGFLNKQCESGVGIPDSKNTVLRKTFTCL